MSTVWTRMACEAGREERGAKIRELLPLDLHLSKLKEEKKGRREGDEREMREEGGERGVFTMCHVCRCRRSSPELCH